ncbi:MAG TPA: hypothetical protein VK147_09055 [Candidatus Didemnitutus sp.]|nr:hypothetical protein [Candidatus Didemnitutus sp.]
MKSSFQASRSDFTHSNLAHAAFAFYDEYHAQPLILTGQRL